MIEFQYELDARGETCPAPVMKTKKILQQMKSHEVVHVMATDPASVQDIDILLSAIEDEMLDRNNEDGVFHYFIRKR